MKKLQTTLSAAVILALGTATAQADCFGGHSVSADAQRSQGTVAISTYDGAAPAPVAQEQDRDAGATQSCPEGEKDCTPGTE